MESLCAMESNRAQKQIRYALLIALLAGAGMCSASTSKIAFAGKTENIPSSTYVINPDGTGFSRLLKGEAASPSWSPDGTEIAFIRWHENFTNSSDVWKADADGSNHQPLLIQGEEEGKTCVRKGTAFERCDQTFIYEKVVWSPFGIVYHHFVVHPTTYNQLCILDGACVRRGPFRFDFTADGRMVYLAGNIRVVDDPFGEHTYRELTGVEGMTGVAVAPDDSRLAVTHDDGLLVMGIDGGSLTPLVEDRSYLFSPSWSPDGKEIAYIEYTSPGGNLSHNAIHVVSADGGDPRVIFGPWEFISSLDWSPWLDTETGVFTVSWGQIKKEMTEK